MNLFRLVTADSLPHNYIGRYILIEMYLGEWGFAVELLVETLRHKPEGRGFDSDGGLGIDTVSNRFEYQEYFLEGKGGRCLGLTTLPSSLSRNLGARISWNPRGM
jgi:hypothetical protein